MRKAEKDAAIDRLYSKLVKQGEARAVARRNAERVFRVVSRVTHAQVVGDQRETKPARAAIDAQVLVNVGHALRVL